MKIQISLCEGATMKKIGRAIPFSIFRTAFLLSVFLLLRPASAIVHAQAPQEVKVIQVDAKKYEFSGSPLHIKKGTRVELKVTATDREHGVKLSVLPDGADPKTPPGLVLTSSQECWKIKKGETATIDFVAQTPGTYSFKCCVDCGLGHHRMKGQIIVDE
jgi:heme/copper-type cytochrome/quinol oxidase subunit 2